MKITFHIAALLLLFFNACGQSASKKENKPNKNSKNSSMNAETITLGNGCFWCTEAIFQQVNGVISVKSGYSGGHVVNPTYEQVCEKNTGHAEVLQVTFDTTQVSIDEILEIFWQTHDPTTLNQQGNDVGPQYRSVVFYHNEHQKERATYFKKQLDASGAYADPIVTAIEPFSNFYIAENYHQNYYNRNGSQPYCYFVIRPKLEKFEKAFKNKLKPSSSN
ncbi:MAG: peptide-methionine (S)-S-oxide reductase MsrA [Bacteroidetes bacterium]|nr:peptide-methionine (S)-S-oxide reductase MsrA [Bacteroidota bacterium]